MFDLLTGLTAPQAEAVQQIDGPLRILAGAGSGKTRVLTRRIAWMIRECGVAPYEILAVTFTNKAAGEMRERVSELLGSADGLWVSTFHSACVRILRRDIGRLGFDSRFSIYDDSDQERLLKEILKQLDVSDRDMKPRAAAAAIDAAKNRGELPGDLPRSDPESEMVARIYERYQQRLQQANALDFGDLLLQTQRLFDEHPQVLDTWRRRFRYIMVDEFQDTNQVQYNLIRSLASVHGNLCVVGDDDQSIYSWRGAEVKNILNFAHDFMGCRTILLEQNYRSSKTILAAAQAVVERNDEREVKELWTENPSGEKLTLETLPGDVDEARFIADETTKLHRNGRNLRDIAVFYRTNAQSRVIEEALRRQNLPYVMFGGVKFYARKEVKDILSYLRLLVNPLDSVAAKRVINSPARGIGATTVGRIAEHEEEAGGFLAACSYAVERGLLPKAASGKVAKFVAMIDQFRSQLGNQPYPQLAAKLIDVTGYADQLRDENTEEAKNRLENIEQLLVGMEETAANMSSLQEYLEQVALITDIDSYDPSLDRVTLMTLHAAKGLEFPVVFMSGMEEELFPSPRSSNTKSELEEERRLCYIGMTRAMDKLYLTHARRRRMFGDYKYNQPSRFLSEIPIKMLDAVAPTTALQHTSEHNLASVFEQMGAESGIDESFVDDDIDSDVRIVPDAEEGLRIGLQVRHAKFGVGKIRRIEGQGDNQKVIVYFKTAGAKKLLLKFAGLEPA